MICIKVEIPDEICQIDDEFGFLSQEMKGTNLYRKRQE